MSAASLPAPLAAHLRLSQHMQPNAPQCITSFPSQTPSKTAQPKAAKAVKRCNISAKEALALTPLHRQAIALLALGQSDTTVARLLDINRSTLYRWRIYNPLFRAALNRLQDSNWSATVQRLRCIFSKATKVMDKNLRSKDPDISFRAAQTLLIHTKPADLAPPPAPHDASIILDEWATALRTQTLGPDSSTLPLTMKDRALAIEKILQCLEPDPLEDDPAPTPSSIKSLS